jgi:hypothetical protein
MLQSIGTVGHIARLFGVRVIHVPVVNDLELDPRTRHQNELDDLVHRDRGL